MDLPGSSGGTEQVIDKVSGTVQKLRNPMGIDKREYHRLIDTFRGDLFQIFKEPNQIAKTLITSMDEQYKLYEGEIPPSHHLFEINVLLTLRLDELEEHTILEIFEHIFPRLSCQKPSYHLLCFFEKIIHRFTFKERETEILRKLQSLMSPSDKKNVKIVTAIIEYILTTWDNQDEQKLRFQLLLSLHKWSKLEFYVCKLFCQKFLTSSTIFETLLDRIFQGFQENHTAYAAHILFEKIVSFTNEVYYNIVENDVVHLLERDNEHHKTLHASLITYVIPTMSDKARHKFMQRSSTFKPVYKLHTIKYYYYKNYVNDIDVELLNDIRKKNPKDKTIISLVWELCSAYSRSERYVQNEHLRLFMNCIRDNYNDSDTFVLNSIHSFLSQMVISIIRNDRPVYLMFFMHLERLVEKVMAQIPHLGHYSEAKALVDIHTRASYLMSRGYLGLRTKYSIQDSLAYGPEQNPLYSMHEKYVRRGWNIIKFYIRSGAGNDHIYNLLEPYRIDYDASFIYAVRKSLMLGLSNPNLDSLERIRTYTKILLKMYKDYSRTFELEDLLTSIMDTLLLQHANVKDSRNDLMYLANPLYTTGEALHVITQEYGEENLAFVFNTCNQVIMDTLALVESVNDIHTRKFIEQIFITHVQLLKTCTKRFYYAHVHVGQFLYSCEQVMCQTKYRKATSVAFNAAMNVISECRRQPLYTEILDHLIEKLDEHLNEVEQVAVNRCSGNKEMLLLIFRTLAHDKAKFKTHFERMLNVSQGYQELHLVALEAICSDAELKKLTSPYLIEVFKKTIRVMSHNNFVSRNAATQLIKVLANRLMGMKSELGQRSVSVLQVFECYPILAHVCLEALYGPNNHSKFGVMTFMGDSPYYASVFGETYEFPRDKIGELMNTPGIKMCATKAFAMTVNSQCLYYTVCNAMQELESDKITACNLLFTEYLLTRLINSETDDLLIKDAITKFENLLKSPGIAKSPEATKYLRYPNCESYKLDLHHKLVKPNMGDILSIFCKCSFMDNSIALIFVCFYIESTFHRLEDRNKRELFQKLLDVFIKYNGDCYLMIRQYYSTIKKLLFYVPTDIITDITCDIHHIFIAEVVTAILRDKIILLENERKVLKKLKDNLPILIKHSEDEEVTSSTINTLTNLLYLFPKVGFLLSDFYFLLIIALFQIPDKNKFCEIFKIITNKNCSLSHYIQSLPKIIKHDLGENYMTFIKKVAKYINFNSKHFFIKHTCLYNCSEKYVNVKIDVFLLNVVLEDLKHIF